MKGKLFWIILILFLFPSSVRAMEKCNIISGNGLDLGSEIDCVGERFYVIETNDDYLKLLSKYNLYVGNYCTASGVCELYSFPSGIQDSTMIARPFDKSYPRKGSTIFSEVVYWNNNELYPLYVYNSSSYIYNLLENYKNYLENNNMLINKIKLISYEELIGLGCNKDLGNCLDAPIWIYGMTYWTGSAFDHDSLWYVDASGVIGSAYYSHPSTCGVRPIIEVNKNNINFGISIIENQNGLLEMVDDFEVGETIVLKVVPKPDYKLSKLIITTISGKKIEIGSNEFIMNNDGTLSIDPKVFVMPLENISIESEWEFINPKTGNSVVFVIVFIILFISMVGGIIIKCPQLK